MSQPQATRLPRTKVNRKAEDEDEDFLDPRAFRDSVPGRFRGRVNEYARASQFPARPLYNIGEVVYLVVPGQTQPAGPFIVSRQDENGMYRIKRQDNLQEHPQPVKEDELVVPA